MLDGWVISISLDETRDRLTADRKDVRFLAILMGCRLYIQLWNPFLRASTCRLIEPDALDTVLDIIFSVV